MVRYGFLAIGLHRIELTAWAFNVRAIASHRKAGFVEEGRRRDAVFHDGAFYDQVLLSVLENDLERLASFDHQSALQAAQRSFSKGGGVLNDMMCHSALLVRHLLTKPGDPLSTVTPKRITARIASLKWSRGEYAKQLSKTMGREVDYSTHPSE